VSRDNSGGGRLPVKLLIPGIAAAGTWAAVMVALFGDWIRARLFPLRLGLELVDGSGDLTFQDRSWIDDSGERQQRRAKARYYYVRVRNTARVRVAHDVQIMLMDLSVEGPDGQPQVRGRGPLPLIWQHQQLYPLLRTVGAAGDEAVANFFFVLESKPLEFMLALVPNNFQHRIDPPLKIWVTLQARAAEGVSKPWRLQIAWNGKWHEGSAEMGDNLKIRVLGES